MGEDYITFTQINDFLYSPASLYMHGSFADKASGSFKAKAQIAGTLEHEAIEEGRYSSHKDILQAKTIYSEKYKILGKIDIFNTKTGELIERKNRVSAIYRGLVYQVWAQYFALREMGYDVKKLYIYSKQDNKKYEIKKPTQKDEEEFADLLRKMRTMNPMELLQHSADANAKQSIYGELAW